MKVSKVLSTMFLLLLVAFSLRAVGGTVTITFNSASGVAYGGAYTYPYDGALNGVPDDFMCISYNEHITNGETWTANVYSVAGYGALVGQPLADELAYLYILTKNAPQGTQSAAYNAAAWHLNEGVPDITGDPVAWADYLEATTATAYPGIGNVLFYVPIDGTQSEGGIPQTFLAQTPEPSTLLMFSSGVIGLVGTLRRKLLP